MAALAVVAVLKAASALHQMVVSAENSALGSSPVAHRAALLVALVLPVFEVLD